jgi:hypothetical protein
MGQSGLQAHREEFDDRNNFLYFVLGMISLSQSVMGSVGLAGEPPERPPAPTGPAEAGEPPQKPLPFSLLR